MSSLYFTEHYMLVICVLLLDILHNCQCSEIRMSKRNRQHNGQKEKVQKDKQRLTNHTHKTKDLMHCQKVKLVRTTSVLFIQRNLQQRDLQSFINRERNNNFFRNKNNAWQANTPVLKQPLLSCAHNSLGDVNTVTLWQCHCIDITKTVMDTR
jgi:hypothetical protein